MLVVVVEVVIVVDVVVVLLVVESVLVVVVVVVVAIGQTSVTMPPPSVATAGCTQLSSTSVCGEPPSGHTPALVTAAANLPCAFVMQPVSRGDPPAAAFA
jgi:hypothetical protein